MCWLKNVESGSPEAAVGQQKTLRRFNAFCLAPKI
jgi:hypothetical protein